ncbi:MAG TPA: glycosyltransferase, partial [Anaerolineae bacterium]|nr:glycosyltransferase [Anaerolineae bacterium]
PARHRGKNPDIARILRDEGRRMLDAVYTYLSAQPFTWELLIVLDGVTDNTLGVIEEFAAGKDGVRWIDRQENMGKGYTVRQGMLAARGQIRLFTDADNSTDMSHFNKMKPLFDQGADVVIASRDHKDAPDAEQALPQPLIKRLLGNAGNLVVQAVAVPGIWDTQCGFKAFRAAAAQEIFSTARINGWGVDMEALALARYFDYQVGIIGAYWVDEPNTHVETLDYFRSLGEAFKVRWNLLTRVYERPSGTSAETQPSEAQPKI